jgi:hypothetical protein
MNEQIKQLLEQAGLTLSVDQQVAFQRAAEMIASAEREACAKVADRQNGDDEEDPESCVWSKAARHIAAAIRARGSK